MAQFLLSTAATVNRWIDVQTPLAPGTLVIERVTGGEQLGRLFEYEVLALSNYGDLPFDDLLGQHLTLFLEQQGGLLQPRRPIDGRIVELSLLGTVQNIDNLYRYRLLLRPWLWLLTQTQDCRIFQNLGTEAIIREVFDDHGDVHFDFRLTAQYPIHEYCVQYRESDFDFVSRLLEEEGMYYFFEHQAGKHVLVVCDAPTAHVSVGSLRMRNDNGRPAVAEPQVHAWTLTHQIRSGAFASRDYNFETPSQTLEVRSAIERPHHESQHEVFDYPGHYVEVGDGGGSDKPEGVVKARRRAEQMHAGAARVEGRTDSRELGCGSLFTLSHHPRDDQNREHLVVRADVEAGNNLPELSQTAAFECRFEVIDAKVQYRSPRTTPRPVVQGPQTAVVVGPDGEEIHVDAYGRIKVQFHWDRRGEYDDQSSCWVRVSQIWAGKNFGWMTVPRVGQEVVVDFLEGNPDRPLITGRIYNAEQMPPWALPDNKTRSGLLTRSSAGGSPANANELHFEDRKGEELVRIHAERNMATSVEVDDSTTVGHDQTLSVGNDRTVTVDHDQRSTVKHDQFLRVEHDRNAHVLNHETCTVDVNQTLSVGGDQQQSVLGNRVSEVKGKQTSVVGQLAADGFESAPGAVRTDYTQGGEFRGVSGDQTVAVGGKQAIEVAGELVYKAKRMHFEAEHIEHKVTGANSVVHESPNGPYSIIANEFKLMSNTDITLAAVGDITQICNKHTVQKMGPSEESFWNNASSFKGGASNDVFIGQKAAANLSLESTTTLGIATSMFVGLKSETCGGINASNNLSMVFGPGAGAPPAGATLTARTVAALFSMTPGSVAGFFLHGVSSVAGAGLAGESNRKNEKEAAASKDAAKKELIDLAEEALKAGKPNVAARMLMMAGGNNPLSFGADSTDSLLAVEGSVDSLAEAIAKAKGEDPERLLQELEQDRKDKQEQAAREQADQDDAKKREQAEADREARQDQGIADLQWNSEQDIKEIEQNRQDIDALKDQAAKDAAASDAGPDPGPDTPKDPG